MLATPERAAPVEARKQTPKLEARDLCSKKNHLGFLWMEHDGHIGVSPPKVLGQTWRNRQRYPRPHILTPVIPVPSSQLRNSAAHIGGGSLAGMGRLTDQQKSKRTPNHYITTHHYTPWNHHVEHGPFFGIFPVTELDSLKDAGLVTTAGL